MRDDEKAVRKLLPQAAQDLPDYYDGFGTDPSNDRYGYLHRVAGDLEGAISQFVISEVFWEKPATKRDSHGCVTTWLEH